MVEVFSRNDEGLWRIRYYTKLDETVEIPGTGIDVTMQDIYFGVELSPENQSDIT